MKDTSNDSTPAVSSSSAGFASMRQRNQCGRPRMRKWMERERAHQIEEVGRELRAMMPWMDAKSAPSV